MPGLADQEDGIRAIGEVRFRYSVDGKAFTPVGKAQPGRGIGAKIGLFAMSAPGSAAPSPLERGNADFDDFIVEQAHEME